MFGKKSFDSKQFKNDIEYIKKQVDIIAAKPKISTALNHMEVANIIKEWEVVIQTQMHFNELLMKLRTATLSIVLAIFGAAGYSILSKDVYLLTLNNFSFHPSVIIISAGLVLLGSMFIMDYFYYYQLLKGAVNRGTKFDEAFKTTDETWSYFGLTTEISNKFGDDDRSKWFVGSFYGIPFIAGILFLMTVIFGFNSS